jgi:AAA domain
MSEPTSLDPYAGNILIAGLGPLRSREEVGIKLTELPPYPLRSITQLPAHVVLHYLMEIRDLHLPCIEDMRLRETIEMMVRQNYRYMNPKTPQAWATVSGDHPKPKNPRAPPFGGLVEGHSGTGKTEAVLRCLNLYPSQVVYHKSFPHLQGSHQQVVWLTVDVPASGKSTDFAAALMIAWDKATGGNRFSDYLTRVRRNGVEMLEEWRQVASAHFLGILHIDEVQNFFKLATLKKRKNKSSILEAPELSIVEDKTLKWILTLMNTWHIPIILSGTPDGIGAITRRLSNTERFVTSGYHLFQNFQSASDPQFSEMFFKELGKYQYVSKKLKVDVELAELVIVLILTQI